MGRSAFAIPGQELPAMKSLTHPRPAHGAGLRPARSIRSRSLRWLPIFAPAAMVAAQAATAQATPQAAARAATPSAARAGTGTTAATAAAVSSPAATGATDISDLGSAGWEVQSSAVATQT